jgi:hypothetical protein
MYIFIPNNSAFFPAVLLYSFIPGHVTVQHYSRPFQVLFPTVFDYLWIIEICKLFNIQVKGYRKIRIRNDLKAEK